MVDTQLISVKDNRIQTEHEQHSKNVQGDSRAWQVTGEEMNEDLNASTCANSRKTY